MGDRLDGGTLRFGHHLEVCTGSFDLESVELDEVCDNPGRKCDEWIFCSRRFKSFPRSQP